MAVTLPTTTDVANFRNAPAENWTDNPKSLTAALLAAIRWASIRVDPSTLDEASEIQNSAEPPPDPLVSPNIGDMWRTAVILKAWGYALTGILPVTSVETLELKVALRPGSGTAASLPLAEQYDNQADETIQMCIGVNLVKYGFPEINDLTQDQIDIIAGQKALGVRNW